MSLSNASGASADIMLNTGSFEMERMLRQNAHEKAFEIKVLAQRQFEAARDKEIIKGRKHLKEEQDKKIGKLNQDLNIARSKMINSARLTKMSERNKCLMELKEMMLAKMVEERQQNRERYLATVKNCILQSMIKLLEPSLKILCREEDLNDVNGMTDDIESEYKSFMEEKTGRDEYVCTLTTLDQVFLKDSQDKGCGGVILYTEDERIVCPNMIINRLHLAFEEYQPYIRNTLFPPVAA